MKNYCQTCEEHTAKEYNRLCILILKKGNQGMGDKEGGIYHYSHD